MEKIKKFFSTKNILILILVIAFLIRLFFIFKRGELFWDAGIYIGISKYLYSFGTIGIFEILRPPVFPLLIGFSWLLNISPIIIGHILVMSASLASIYFVFKIGKRLINERVGLIAAFLLALSHSHIFYSSRILADNISIFLCVLGFYLFITKKKPLLTGLVIGLAFLTRFTNGILLLVIAVYGLYELIKSLKEKDSGHWEVIKHYLILLSGYLLLVIPFMVLNYIYYGNPFTAFIEAGAIIAHVGKTIYEGFGYYPLGLLRENLIILIFLGGLVITFTEKIKNKAFVISIIGFILFFFFYLSNIAHKEFRYMLIILPFIYIIIGMTVDHFHEWHSNKKFVNGLCVFLFLLILVQLVVALQYYSPHQASEEVMQNYYNRAIAYENVVISGPGLMAYQDIKPEMIYSIQETTYEVYIKNNPNAFFLNTCELYTPDPKQEVLKQQFFDKLSVNYTLTYNGFSSPCEYFVFEKTEKSILKS
jgi:4-amino-4-deoxy-L-arabinose transferase-like glycosyltransferase